jgi:cobalt-zinc-cadmium efflux system outer membrane protein
MRTSFERRLLAPGFALLLAAPPLAGASPGDAPTARLGADLPTFEAPPDPGAAGTPGAATTAAAPDPVGRVGLRDALAAALVGSPELAAQSYEIRARESAALQAGLRPNPELDLALEDFAGSGIYRAFHATEGTLRIGQLVELGGKRAARIRLAEREHDLAAFDWETARLDVLTRTTLAFLDLLQAQEELRVSEENVRVARELVRSAGERARAGAGAPDEAPRFGVAAQGAEIERRRAQRGVETARLRLAASWGADAARFERAEGDLARVVAPPAIAHLRARIAQSPDLARWESEVAARSERVALERSRTAPDVRVGPGVRWYAETDDTAFVLGAAVPLPLWNRNQGAVAEARHRLAKATAERRAAAVRAGANLAAAHALATSALAEAETLERDALPAAEASYRTVRSAYDAGRLGALDLLEAQRTRLALQAQRLRALGDHHRAVAEIERLLGAPIDAEPGPPAPDPTPGGGTR